MTGFSSALEKAERDLDVAGRYLQLIKEMLEKPGLLESLTGSDWGRELDLAIEWLDELSSALSSLSLSLSKENIRNGVISEVGKELEERIELFCSDGLDVKAFFAYLIPFNDMVDEIFESELFKWSQDLEQKYGNDDQDVMLPISSINDLSAMLKGMIGVVEERVQDNMAIVSERVLSAYRNINFLSPFSEFLMAKEW